jgi:hypothetical protein
MSVDITQQAAKFGVPSAIVIGFLMSYYIKIII